MANEWQSLLPSAWKPQDPNTQVQAAKAGAETALTNAQTATQAVDAVARNQERIRKQALQDVIAASVRTSIDPQTGKLIKVVDQDRFLDAMSKSPAAADAWKEYVSTVYPQVGREEVQRSLSSAITPEGGMDATKLAAAAQRSRFGADVLNAAAEQQKSRLAGAEAQATSLTGINALTTSPAGAAPPGTIVGNTQMQVRPLDGSTASGTEPAVTAEAVDKLSPTTRSAAVINLRAAGSPLSDNPSSAEIAKAASDYADAQVQSGLMVKSLGDLPASVFNLRQKAPALTREALGKIFGGELDIQGKKTANKRAGIETESLAAGVDKTVKLARDLGIDPDMVGNAVSPETQSKVQLAENAVRALGNLEANIKDIVKDIDSGKIKLNTVEGNDDLTRRLIAQMQSLADIYGGSSTEGGIERALKDVGAPSHLAEAIQRGGWEGAVRGWVSNKTINVREQIATAPRRAAESVINVLSDVNAANPADVLRRRGFGHLLSKEHLKPSVFSSKSKSGDSSKYKATKINAAGMRMGQKADGKWEPIQ